MIDKMLSRRGAILDLLTSQARALHAREIAARLHIEESAYPGLLRALDELAYTGAISPLAGQRFRATKNPGRPESVEREGVLSVNPRGFGFVASVGHTDDLFIPEESMSGAMHGDLVCAKWVATSSRGSEGLIVRVLKRSNERVAGVLRRRGRGFVLEPDDTRVRGPIILTEPRASRAAAPSPLPSEPEPATPISSPSEGSTTASNQDLAPAMQAAQAMKRMVASAEDGAAAVVRITQFPEEPREQPCGQLEAVLGPAGEPRVEVAKILAREGVEEPHSQHAIAEAQRFGAEVPAEALEGREDFCHLPLPTIDPEDARDHDDALWVRREQDGSYTAWIAIADVSHYVRPGTAIDREARARGCSVYLPDRAIPMLPRALSSHLCSLLPDTVRLCMCIEARLDAAGVVTSYRIAEGYMRSAAKLSYGQVARTLKLTDAGPKEPKAEALADGLGVLHELAMLLRRNRMRRGALDLDLPEAHVSLDPETGAPMSIEKRGDDPGVRKAYRLVEELMLLGNELVAQFLTERGVPTIYRVHGPPDEEKLDRFATMCNTLGISFDIEEAKDPKKLSSLLKRVKKHSSHDVVHMLLLRAMKQAVYDVANIGHFGLASSHYLHFTSPIRRYPDLVVHRSLRAALRGQPIDKSPEAIDLLRDSATSSSERERRAMDIEREAVDLYRAIYMQRHLGELFSGRATGLVGSGVFVQLDTPFVDVLVKADDLGADSYELDDTGLRIVGARSGDSIALGDPVDIEIVDAAVLRRTVYGKRIAGPRIASERPAKVGRRGRKAVEMQTAARRDGAKGGKSVRPAPGARAPAPGRSESKRKSESKSHSKSESKSHGRSESKSHGRSESKSHGRSESKSHSKSESHSKSNNNSKNRSSSKGKSTKDTKGQKRGGAPRKR